MKNIINYVILFILLFIVIYQHNNPRIKTNEIIKTDTIYKQDTIIKEKPTPIYIKSEPDTIYIPSIDSSVPINREIKIYKDSTYEAQISGIEPFLDYIKVFPRQTTIYKEKVSEIKGKQPLIEFKPSIGVGYGLKHQKVDMYIGGSIVFNIK